MTFNRKSPSIVKNLKNATIGVGTLPQGKGNKASDPSNDELYCVMVNGKVLRTPNGNPITFHDDRPAREMAAELDFSDALDVSKINLYSLCSTQIDYSKMWEFKREDLQDMLLNDPVLRTCSGPEVIEQMKYLKIVIDFLEDRGIKYPNLPQIPLGRSVVGLDTSESYTKEILKDPNFIKFVDFVSHTVAEFDEVKKTAFVNVFTVFDSPILGIMLATNEITPQEFAVVFLTANALNSKVWGDVDRAEEKSSINKITKEAECINRYLRQFPPKLTDVEKLIQMGENKQLEFKSTLRWNLIADRADQAMEHAVLKSISAFLNSDGGTLLVGVKDDGSILGIENDNFANEDKYLLHFSNIFNESIGKRYADLVKWDLVPINGIKVLHIRCEKSPNPIFLRNKGNEEFFVRTGPSTVQLTSSEMLDYSKRHF